VAVSVITTLATPYLIKGSDGLAARLDRSLPRPMMQALSVYTTWIGSFGQRAPGPTTLLMRRMGWQILLNLLLTMGVFAGGAWVARRSDAYLPYAVRAPEVHQTLVWLAVMVVNAPIYLASARKIQAISMLLSEICVPGAGTGPGAAARLVISQVFILSSFTVMTFLTVLLSTSILSSIESMLPLLLMVTVAALLFRPILVRIYSRAEIALHETLVELPRLRQEDAQVIPEFLREAELESMEIPAGSSMVGRKLREIPLRAQTGASIVAIERGGQRQINPGPDEVLRPGDRVLLLGASDQLPDARTLLAATE
jgi:CPA2 family monovalent cation:H+ antiporter-2